MLWFLVGLLHLAPIAAQARDLIVERSWFEDASGVLSYDDVQSQPTKPFTGVLSKGFGDSAIWIKVRLAALPKKPAFAPDQIAVRVRPTFLDNIRLYDPAAGGLAGEAGDRVPMAPGGLRLSSYVFIVAAPSEPRDLWLRVESTSTRSFVIDAVDAADLAETEGMRTLVIGAYFGIILLFLIWSVILWIKGRERVVGAFTLKQIAACLFGVSVLGWHRLLLPETTPLWLIDTSTSVFGILAVSTSIAFEIVFTAEFDPPKWSKTLLRALLILLPLELALIFGAGNIGLALTINMAQLLVVPPFVLLAVAMARGWRAENPDDRPALPRWLVISYYIVLLTLLVSASAIGLGFTDGVEPVIYISLAYGFVTGLMLLLLLQYRMTVLAKRQAALSERVIHAELESDRERILREENEKLFAIIAQEMRTPMSSLRLITGLKAPTPDAIGKAQQAVRDMNDIIERCAQTEQVETRRVTPVTSKFSVADVLTGIVARSAWRADIQCNVEEIDPIQSDEQLLRLVLGNMVDNACKYGLIDQPIDISVRASSKAGRDGVAISVANLPGAGGWPDASRMFEKYYRSPSSRGVSGSGLGLYLVANLARTLQGEASYEPDETHVRFVLWLPRELVSA